MNTTTQQTVSTTLHNINKAKQELNTCLMQAAKNGIPVSLSVYEVNVSAYTNCTLLKMEPSSRHKPDNY